MSANIAQTNIESEIILPSLNPAEFPAANPECFDLSNYANITEWRETQDLILRADWARIEAYIERRRIEQENYVPEDRPDDSGF